MMDEVEFVDEEDGGVASAEANQFSQAVLYASDWTVETLVSQLQRENIEMNPRFQRRDAWSTKRKSAFIESLILGLPVPQIVLAEKQGQRGRYIVLDGKQRLLSLLQFTGLAQGSKNNGFRLSGLEARKDLMRETYSTLQENPAYEDVVNAFMNYTVRTVVIRNWPNFDFLHLVFLRLNTGSVKLSPQELRQAMFPGDFSDFVDDKATESEALRTLLGRNDFDPRMRDVELLVRFLGFHNFLPDYAGRMKDFLDATCERFNTDWPSPQGKLEEDVENFNASIAVLSTLLGPERVARKSDSTSFNRAIFDALMFYAAHDPIRVEMQAHPDAVVAAYDAALANPQFLAAVESDTAGIPNTVARLRIWGSYLQVALGMGFPLPEVRPADAAVPESRAAIEFAGFEV